MITLGLLNLLMIVFGPFAVVGAVAGIAELGGAGLKARVFPPSRPVRPAMRWAVA